MTEEIQNDKGLKNERALLIIDRFMDSFDVIVAKMTSGKFLAITFDTVGYTAGVVITGVLAYKKIIDPAVFIAVLGTYALLVKETRISYFGMNKDKQEQNGGSNVESPTKLNP